MEVDIQTSNVVRINFTLYRLGEKHVDKMQAALKGSWDTAVEGLEPVKTWDHPVSKFRSTDYRWNKVQIPFDKPGFYLLRINP